MFNRSNSFRISVHFWRKQAESIQNLKKFRFGIVLTVFRIVDEDRPIFLEKPINQSFAESEVDKCLFLVTIFQVFMVRSGHYTFAYIVSTIKISVIKMIYKTAFFLCQMLYPFVFFQWYHFCLFCNRYYLSIISMLLIVLV